LRPTRISKTHDSFKHPETSQKLVFIKKFDGFGTAADLVRSPWLLRRNNS
jgi:hypothetical protein